MPGRLVVLCILDGWGYRSEARNNAVALGNTPTFDHYWKSAPRCFLRTDGEQVGLPSGQFGNSEVGHMNLGAGRIVLQDLPRIDHAVDNGKIENSPPFSSLVGAVKQSGGRVHLMGLLSPGGVHAHQRHMIHIASSLDKAGVEACVHAFLDGRDTPPRSALGYVESFEEAIGPMNNVRLASVSGRYYAMDRDRRWERTKLAFDMLVHGQAHKTESFLQSINQAYANDLSDEFIEPTCEASYPGMNDGDALLCTNFRADRCRQLLSALVEPEFDGFSRSRRPVFAGCVGMTSYSSALDHQMTALFDERAIEQTLGEVVAAAGLPQTRMAETEKYPHVTFFFNGGREEPFENEQRHLVPSPKVATYDLKPEMSAVELNQAFLALEQSSGFILINFANPDMVGHTGDLQAAIKAVETVDRCLGELLARIERLNGVAIVTADHGNCELMVDPDTGEPHTAHTTNPVPCFVVGLPASVRLSDGKLADIAPTILDLLDIEKPVQMTGDCLLRETA